MSNEVHTRFLAALILLLLAGTVVVATASAAPMANNNLTFIGVANDAGVKYDYDGAVYGSGANNTYFLKMNGSPTQGYNEIRVTTDPVASPNGQATSLTAATRNPSGTFSVMNTGGTGITDDVILLLAVNGTIPSDFAVQIRSGGYNWTASPVRDELPTVYAHEDNVVSETFTASDFAFGPQNWKPGSAPGLPLYYGQDMGDGETYSLLFVDLKVGAMNSDKFPGVTLIGNGSAKVEYSFTNLTSRAAFNAYGWRWNASQGQGISWTNKVTSSGQSGYTVLYSPPAAPVAGFSANTTTGLIPLPVEFTDTSTGDSITSYEWVFSDNPGTVFSDRNVTHTFTNAGLYSVSHSVTNAAGTSWSNQTDYINATEEIPPPPVADFTADVRTGPAPLTVVLTDNTTGESVTGYQWILGDNPSTIYTTQNRTHTFTTAGSFAVNHSSTNAGGTSWSNQTDYIVVTSHVSRIWTVGASGCDFTTITDALAEPLLFDGDTIYVTNGTYPLGASVTKAITLTGEGTGVVTVTVAGQAISGTGAVVEDIRFSGTTITLNGPNSIIRDCLFQGLTSGEAIKLYGNSVTMENCSIRNNAVDRVLDLMGGNCIIANTTFSNNGVSPSQSTIRMNAGGCAGNTIARNNFLNNKNAGIGLRGPGANNRIYLNNFIGNGGSTPVYRFQNSGAQNWVSPAPVDYTYNGMAYSAVLGNYWSTYTGIDTDGNGIGDTSYYLGVASQTDNAPLMTRWQYLFGGAQSITAVAVAPSSDYVHVGETRQFTATAYDELGLVMPGRAFTWASTNEITGSVDQNGFFTALADGTTSLTATNNTVTGSSAVQVTASPLANFTANQTSGGAPFPVHFTDISLSSPTSWAWDFDGDGNIDSYEQNPDYTYLVPGTYSVNLTVTNGYGSTNMLKTGYIYVPPVPVANFTASATGGIAPLFVRFTDTSTGVPSSWFWEFGDGGTSTAQSPTHVFMAAGTYTVNLTASNTAGSDSENKTELITVSASTLGLADTPWPKLQKFSNNTGVSPYSGPQTGNVIWNFTTGGAITGSPVIGADGTIYTGSADGKLYALYPNGTQKWNYTTGGAILASPAIRADGTIYVGSGNSLIAVNSDGTLKWSYNGGGAVKNSPAIGSDGTVYTSMYNRLYAVNDTGTGAAVKWSISTGSGLFNNPAIGTDGTLYWGSSNYIWSINPDGTQNWRFQSPVGMSPKTAAIGSDGTIYFFDGNSLQAMDGGPVRISKWRTGDIGACYAESPAIGTDGTIYFGNQRSKFWAFTDTGAGYTEKWNVSVGGYVKSPAAIGADGTLYFGCDDFRLYALDPDGTLKWRYLTGNKVTGGLAIGSDGTLYAGSTDGKLYAFKDVAPVAEFTGTPLTGDAPLSVRFNDMSANTPTSWSWEFGDTGTSAEKNPVHVYSLPGLYTVNLNVTNVMGSNSTSRIAYVNVTLAPPIANFTSDVQTGQAPLTVSFSDNSTGVAISGHQWIISDDPATVITTRHHTHIFTDPGIYSVSHSVTNDAGNSWKNETDYITVTNQSAIVGFKASPSTGNAPLTVAFTDTSTAIGITAYGWVFSDNLSAVFTDRNVTHTFTAAGKYSVSHSVTNDGGTAWTNKTHIITVNPGPPDITSISPAKHARNGKIFTATVRGASFQPGIAGTTVTLSRGSKTIVGKGVNATSATEIACSFRIPRTAATGPYSVTVKNPDGQTDIIVNGFRVKA